MSTLTGQACVGQVFSGASGRFTDSGCPRFLILASAQAWAMSWVRIDDRWWCNPEVLRLTPEARDLFVRLLSYAGMFDTDGVLTSAAADTVDRPTAKRRGLLEQLVACAFLSPEGDGGFSVVDWESYLLPREEVAARRAQRS